MKNPSQIVESDQLVFAGKIAKVHKVMLRMDDGQVVSRELIRYPGAAVVLPVLDDGSIVLIRQYRFAVGGIIYELPAGMLDGDEDPAGCAVRELAEETGYVPGELIKLIEFYSAPGTSDEVLHAFLASKLKPGPQALEMHEQITLEIVSDARARQMVLSGEIRDGKTIATLSLYWLGGHGPKSP